VRGATRRTATGVLAVAVIALISTGCTSGSNGSNGSRGITSAVSGGTKTVLSVDQRRAPIELSGTTLEGERLDLATLRGKPVVLNIWGSWCPPCRKEAPDLQAAATELDGKASFVGLDTGENAAAQALAYQRRFKITYPSILDDGDQLLALRGVVSSKSPPVTVVLDAQGRVAGRFVGPVTRLTLVDMVHDVSTPS
jgi:thiol-disulfide isomerase/thioredoxin